MGILFNGHGVVDRVESVFIVSAVANGMDGSMCVCVLFLYFHLLLFSVPNGHMRILCESNLNNKR